MHIVEEFEIRHFEVLNYCTNGGIISGRRKTDNKRIGINMFASESLIENKSQLLCLTISLEHPVSFTDLSKEVDVNDLQAAIDKVICGFEVKTYKLSEDDDDLLTASDIDNLLNLLNVDEDDIDAPLRDKEIEKMFERKTEHRIRHGYSLSLQSRPFTLAEIDIFLSDFESKKFEGLTQIFADYQM